MVGQVILVLYGHLSFIRPNQAEYADIFNDQDYKSRGKIEIDRYFLNIENLRTLNVFMGLNISLYKETIGEKNDCIIQLYQAFGN